MAEPLSPFFSHSLAVHPGRHKAHVLTVISLQAFLLTPQTSLLWRWVRENLVQFIVSFVLGDVLPELGRYKKTREASVLVEFTVIFLNYNVIKESEMCAST